MTRDGPLWIADGSETWDGRWGSERRSELQGVSFERPHLGVATTALEFGSQAATGWLIGVGGGSVAQGGQRGRRGRHESVRGEGGALGGGGGEPLRGGRWTRGWRTQAESGVSNERRERVGPPCFRHRSEMSYLAPARHVAAVRSASRPARARVPAPPSTRCRLTLG